MADFSSVVADIDYERDGKQFGNLRLVQSANVMGWQTVLVPIVCVRNGNGPTLLLLGGTHGDEVDGPVVLLKLARALQPDEVRGRVVIIPALNYPAVEAGQRGAPSDGRDLNRSFPGRPDGMIAEIIAHYLDEVLLPMSDVALDLHAGGQALRFLPSLWLLDGPGPELWRRTMEAARAFGAPHVAVSASLGGDMSESAASCDCVYMSTEAGGGLTVDPDVVAMSESGIRRLMAHMALTPPEAAPPSAPPPRMLRVPANRTVVLAGDHGLFEPLARLGDEVGEGQVIGRIHRLERPDDAALDVVSTISGLVYGLRWSAQVQRTSPLAFLAQDA